MKSTKFFFGLCCSETLRQANPLDKSSLIREEIHEDTIQLAFSEKVDEINYEQALLILLDKVQYHPDKAFKSFTLDLSHDLYFNWNILMENLSSAKQILSRVTSLKFNESSLSLKQLRQLYWLFKEFQKEEMLFPEISIDMSPAVYQLFENEKCPEKIQTSNLRSNSNRRNSRSRTIELMPGRIIDKDISKEEFMIMINEEGDSGNIFLRKTHWNGKRTLYEDLSTMPALP